MFFCLRVDLDYVPWDTPDAAAYGHGEPAILLRMLNVARQERWRLQFFASTRVLRAFPSQIEAVLSEGHALDWLCKHPQRFAEKYQEAKEQFAAISNPILGFAVRHPWPVSLTSFQPPEELRFLSAPIGPAPQNVRLFPVETPSDREAARAHQTPREWADVIRAHLRAIAPLEKGATISVRPQVLAKVDPRLSLVKEIADLASAIGFAQKTLRELI
jgi:hypothetical protein